MAERKGGKPAKSARRADTTEASQDVVRPLTANELRRLAESADGMRGKKLKLTNDRPGGHLTEVPANYVVVPEDVIVETQFRNAARKIPTLVEVTKPTSGTKHELKTDYFDSVFWGEAAMEKFLVPYYVRFCEDAEMSTLRASIASGDIIALAHIYPTYYTTLEDSLYVLATGPAGFISLGEWLRHRRR
jgi:hypothetical protein